jgi:ribosome-associated translation inhibitor RaiA
MRIQVLGDDTIGPQARTYAEYRLFAALTQGADADPVSDARVVLRTHRRRQCAVVTCTVTVSLGGRRTVRIRARGDHAYAAINQAVERLRDAGPRAPGHRGADASAPGRHDGAAWCPVPCPTPCHFGCMVLDGADDGATRVDDAERNVRTPGQRRGARSAGDRSSPSRPALASQTTARRRRG